MKYKEWKAAVPDRRVCEDLTAQLGRPPLLAALLAARGVSSPEEARRLLSPAEEPLLSPMLLRDMDRAVARVRRALETGERLAVYGDYDVDGITATCLLTQFLSGLGGNVTSYIPGRLDEGYGLNREAIDLLARDGVTLILTVDCGITAVDEVEYARCLGVDVVITDHHSCKQALPDAAAVVDPTAPTAPTPSRDLRGWAWR